ncbi:retrovirus-related pol polyprotein from transposon TNT 1-94 [Tanacetum coccineum]
MLFLLVVIPNNVHSLNQPPEHISKWTKDHSIDNVINDPSRPVSTRHQLQTAALFCYFDAFLSFVEPKSYKEALIESCWIEAMQEELNEFERLEVWELVPRPDRVMIITLKWIYKKFSKGTVDPTLFIRREGKDILLISQSPRGIFLNQSKYALEITKEYGMETSDPVDTPMVEKSKLDADPQGKEVDPTRYHEMISFLMYLTVSRPDLQFAVCMCACSADVDHAGCQDTRRSTPGSMQLLGDRFVSWWKLNKFPCQDVVLKWTRSHLTDYGLGFNKIPLYCDNKSAIALCCNNVQHSRSKHVNIRYHFIKEQVENEVVELYSVRTEYQLTDIFTKALGRERLDFLINKLGMRNSNTVFNLKASISPKRKLDLTMRTPILGHDLLYDHAKACVYFAIQLVLPISNKVDFAEIPDDETTLTFLLDLGYKGLLYKHPDMYMNHMHQPWRNLAAIINKYLFGKAASNDRLRKSRIDILWGMFYRENVDYPELIWEDFAFQIDYRQLKKGKRENMPYPSTRVIKKKVTISADDNIVPEPDIALELGKSISLTEAAEEKVARQVYAAHARIVTESVLEPAKRRPSEQLAGDTMKALKESKKTSKRQLVVPATSSEGTGTKPGVLNEEKITSEANHRLEETDDEEITDEFVHSKENVQDDDEETDDEDKEMTNDEDDDTGNGDEELTDAAKADVEKTEVVKDEIKKAELPPTSSSLSVYSGFVLTPIPENPLVAPATTLPPHPTVSSISHVLQQTTTSIPTPPITTEAPSVTTIPYPLSAIIQRVSVLEKDSGRCTSKGASETYGRTDPEVSLFLPKDVFDFATPVIQSTVKNALEKTPLLMDKSRSSQTHDKHQALYDALLNLLILNDDIARGQADAKKVMRKRDRDGKDPSTGPNKGKKTKKSRTKVSELSKKSSTSKETSKGKSPAKTSKSSKSMTAEEPVEEPVVEMTSDVIEQTVDDVVNDIDQPPDDSTQTKGKAPKQDWFKQLSRPPTPDPEWNKHQVVIDQPEQPWFNQMVYAIKNPISFDELMATPIDFSNIELEYNMEECFKALKDRLDWNNPEGDCYPLDLTKPLPLKGRLGCLTVTAEYFFNNDLEFLKSLEPENTYTTSITKTKAARYEIVGIEDMVLTLWSATKVGYDKDVLKRIKHWGERRKLCVSVKKLHGYGHLEEITMRRADRQVYKFKEGDLVDLHLNDIKDMLLLVVQHKLFQLDGSDVDLIVALRMFTRTQKTFPRIEFKELYTPSYKPPGVIYKDLNKQKRVMRANELYNFLDRTLKTVHDALHHRILYFCLGYNKEMSRIKWTAIDKRRSELMVELIDKQMRERQIIRNLKRLVGARELVMDYTLMI